MRKLPYILLANLGLVMSLHGQGASRTGTPSADQRKQIDQATEKFRQAQSNGTLDKAKGTAKELLQKLPEGVADAAKAIIQNPEAKAKALDAVKSAAQSVLPQAQGMLNQRGLPAVTTPAVQEQPPSAPIAEGPRPGALMPLVTNAAKQDQPTAVIEADNSVFDLKAAIFIYTGHVRARHPDFYIECEELEVFMVKEEAPKADKKPAVKPSAQQANDSILTKDDKAEKKNPIRKAIARGPMVTIEKRDEQGNVQQGKCRRLDYDAVSGDIVLSDFPQVQRGNVLHIATQSDTTMVFDKTGKLRTNGRPRTVILSGDEAKPAQPNGQ